MRFNSILFLFAIIFVVSMVGLVVVTSFSHGGVDGEFEEGWIFGEFEGYKIREPVCCSYYGSTEIKLQNHSWMWFHYNCEYVMEDNLEVGKVYGFYYTSSEVSWAITREWGEPQGRWLPYIDKVVDCENNILWESHYHEMPQVCWTIIGIGVVIIILIGLACYKYDEYKEGKEEKK